MSLVESAVGYSLTRSIRNIFCRLEPWRCHTRLPLKGVRIAIQGAGTVGTGVALFASRSGAQIVAISDEEGVLYCSEGLPIEKLFSERERQLRLIHEGHRAHYRKLICRYCAPPGSSNVFREVRKIDGLALTTLEEVRRAGAVLPGIDVLLAHLLSYAERANVFVPAAMRYTINKEALAIACNGMWDGARLRALIPGTNNPFGSVGKEALALRPSPEEIEGLLKNLREEHIVYIPDYLANGGTAQLFHSYASGKLNWAFDDTQSGSPVLDANDQERVLDSISETIDRTLTVNLEDCEPSLLDLPWRMEHRVRQLLAAASSPSGEPRKRECQQLDTIRARADVELSVDERSMASQCEQKSRPGEFVRGGNS